MHNEGCFLKNIAYRVTLQESV